MATTGASSGPAVEPSAVPLVLSRSDGMTWLQWVASVRDVVVVLLQTPVVPGSTDPVGSDVPQKPLAVRKRSASHRRIAGTV